MKAVILESYVMEPGDLDWSGVKALDETRKRAKRFPGTVSRRDAGK